MGAVVRKAIVLFSSVVMTIILLSVFSLVYDNSGIKTKDEFGATGSKWQGKQYVANMVEGFGWLFSDENGYNNEAIESDIDVLVMGDSYMEAIQVMQWQNAASLLQKNTGCHVYNISIAGRRIYNRVMSLENALLQYKPSDYIILNLDRAQLDIDEMGQAIEHRLPISSTIQFSSGPMYYVKQIPCVKPILYQLKQWKDTDNNQKTITIDDGHNSFDNEKEYRSVLHEFLMQIKTTADESGVKPIILYHPDVRLNTDGSISFSSEGITYVRILHEECSNCGIILVDMTDNFNELYDERHILVYGFPNTAVGTGHINIYGHDAIANRLTEVIMEDYQ